MSNFTDFMSVIGGPVNDTTHPRHFNDTVLVACQRGYTLPGDVMVREFMCRHDGNGILGWYDMYDSSMSSQKCTGQFLLSLSLMLHSDELLISTSIFF